MFQLLLGGAVDSGCNGDGGEGGTGCGREGETDEEVEDTMWEIRETGCDILSLGQFLSPTIKHLGVERWVSPDTFNRLAEVGRAMGFMYVESGPMVRSSYMAHRPFETFK